METNATLYQLDVNSQIGVLCRTSSGIRFVVDDMIYIALDNEAIDTVTCHSLSFIGASVVERLGCKALNFKDRNSSTDLTFVVPVATAKSWSKHFNTFEDETVREQI